MIDNDDGFCPYSHDPEMGGHSPEWTAGDACRWCGRERLIREPDIEVTPDLRAHPWTSHRGGSYRQGDVRRVGLYHDGDRGALVAILARLADGSDAIVYASLSTVEAAVELLTRSPVYLAHRQAQRAGTTWPTVALAGLCVTLAGVLLAVVFR